MKIPSNNKYVIFLIFLLNLLYPISLQNVVLSSNDWYVPFLAFFIYMSQLYTNMSQYVPAVLSATRFCIDILYLVTQIYCINELFNTNYFFLYYIYKNPPIHPRTLYINYSFCLIKNIVLNITWTVNFFFFVGLEPARQSCTNLLKLSNMILS